MRKTWILVFAVIIPVLSDARTINVSDHGIVPGKDVTYELNRLIKSIQDEADVSLSFPRGQYDFHPENSLEVHRAVSNHDNGLKRMVFPLFNHKNITIDGNGSLFMMHGRVVPFTIESVEGVTLKNFRIDWIRSFHAEMKVVERDVKKNMAIFEIDPERYPYTVKDGELLFDRYGQLDPMGSNIVFDPNTRAPIYDTGRYALTTWTPDTIIRAGKNRVKLEGLFRKEPPPVGSVLVVYGVHPTSRLCPAIHVTNSKDLMIENVTIHEAGGMGLIVERTENCTLNKMVVTSNDERLVATRADATHFIGCKGTIRVGNCLFEHMLDDGINVHGAYVPVAKSLGNCQFLCDISHFQQWGLIFAEPGDKVALMSRATVLPFYQTEVKDIKILNEHRFVLTVTSVPDKLPDLPLSVENLTWYPDLIMRNNIIRENRARSVLVTTKGRVLIENNIFSSQMHGILIEGDNNKWYESGAVEDVVIRSNVFENIGYGLRNHYPLVASPLLNKTQHMGEGHYHRNITFANNIIKSFNGHLVQARSVSGLKVIGNTVELKQDYSAAKEGETVVLEYCDDVVVKGNRAKGFTWPLKITQTDHVTNTTIKQNQGFTDHSKAAIPTQANAFVWIYKPAGDRFFGPDTPHLKEGQWYNDWVPNDHAFIKDDSGKWHIFGITHPLVETDPLSIGIHEGEYASFHAVSSINHFKETLKQHHYIDLPKVLPPKTRPGEPLANHAPTIVKKDGLYYMVYGHSPIRLAVSPDLSQWTPKGNLFTETDGARDPSLLYHNGIYYMVYCSLKSVRLRTSKDLIHWSESKVIFEAKSYDPESPTLIYYQNAFYLFVCSWNGVWDGKDIQGAYQHKTYVLHSQDPFDFGVDHEKQITTLKGHAPEIFQDEEGQWYISSVEWPYRGVSVDRLEWTQ